MMDKQKETGHFSCNAGGLWGRGFLSMTDRCPGPREEQSKSCPDLEGAQGALHTRGGSFHPERPRTADPGAQAYAACSCFQHQAIGWGEEAGHGAGLGGSWGRL